MIRRALTDGCEFERVAGASEKQQSKEAKKSKRKEAEVSKEMAEGLLTVDGPCVDCKPPAKKQKTDGT